MYFSLADIVYSLVNQSARMSEGPSIGTAPVEGPCSLVKWLLHVCLPVEIQQFTCT